jgi:uncharacterized protein
MNDPILDLIVDEMRRRHECHTIILYGSRAAGTQNPESDYDVCGFRSSKEEFRDCRQIGGSFLDAWIYHEDRALQPDLSLLHIRDGLVLAQSERLGTNCLEKLQTLYAHGPDKLPYWEVEMRVSWLKKTVARAARGDAEGKYRAHWLIVQALEYYFELQNRWYNGPKESLKWLAANDPTTYAAFQKVLGEPIHADSLCQLVEAVIKRADYRSNLSS